MDRKELLLSFPILTGSFVGELLKTVTEVKWIVIPNRSGNLVDPQLCVF